VQLFKSGQAGADTARYSPVMGIVRDHCVERLTRVDRMIDEFRQAQSRLRARAIALKGDDQRVESQRDAHPQATVAGSTTPPASHEND
jgi:hypothetical protein